MAFKDKLKKARKEANMTQSELAEKSGLSFSYVAKLEIGDAKNPTFDTIEKLASALGIDSSDLLTPISLSIDESKEHLARSRISVGESHERLDTQLDALNERAKNELNTDGKKAYIKSGTYILDDSEYTSEEITEIVHQVYEDGVRKIVK
jgi:transcriptional regulator with XRE-family HTH domain